MDGRTNGKDEQIHKEMNTELPVDARNRDGHFPISSLSVYEIEAQPPGAHKEVTPQSICKQLLVKSPAREITFREENMVTHLLRWAFQVLSPIKPQPGSIVCPQEFCKSVLTKLQVNTMSSAFIKICCKNHFCISCKIVVGEIVHFVIQGHK